MKEKAGDSELLRHLQQRSFEYFLHEVNPSNGLILDKTEEDWPCSIAADATIMARITSQRCDVAWFTSS